MKQQTKSKFLGNYEQTTFVVSEKLSEKLRDMKPPAVKIEKAKEFLRKVDPGHFKAVTGKDLFQK